MELKRVRLATHQATVVVMQTWMDQKVTGPQQESFASTWKAVTPDDQIMHANLYSDV